LAADTVRAGLEKNMFTTIMKQLRPTILAMILFTLIGGVIYPLLVTGVAQAVFPRAANGSLITKGDKTLGSDLIGQPFSDPGYFWGRISATSPKPYDAGNSTGSNLGPTNPALLDNVKGRIKDLKDADPSAAANVPVDLVTSSASGLDPHISPEAAEYQVKRVAKARGMDEAAVRTQMAKFTQDRQLGFLGEPTVNVLQLNLALDEAKPLPAKPAEEKKP